MKKYKVVPLDSAQEDMANILSYIRDQLINDFAAQKYAKLFEKELRDLSYFANGGALLNDYSFLGNQIRIAHVKKYIFFYIVDEKKLEVRILRVGHSLMDWDKLLDN